MGAVCIVPVTDDGRVIIERQYRYPVDRVITEIPAGKLNDKQEDPLLAAQRELREETGLTASHWESLGIFYPAPAYSDETIHMFLAKGLHLGAQQLDADEFLEVTSVPLADLAGANPPGRDPGSQDPSRRSAGVPHGTRREVTKYKTKTRKRPYTIRSLPGFFRALLQGSCQLRAAGFFQQGLQHGTDHLLLTGRGIVPKPVEHAHLADFVLHQQVLQQIVRRDLQRIADPDEQTDAGRLDAALDLAQVSCIGAKLFRQLLRGQAPVLPGGADPLSQLFFHLRASVSAPSPL